MFSSQGGGKCPLLFSWPLGPFLTIDQDSLLDSVAIERSRSRLLEAPTKKKHFKQQDTASTKQHTQNDLTQNKHMEPQLKTTLGRATNATVKATN